MPSRVTVEAPASSANLGAGFDVFAIALGKPRDRLTLEKRGNGVTLSVQASGFQTSARNNVVSGVAKAMIKGEGIGQGVSLSLLKEVPIGAGLGSSAASSAAAAVGMDFLFDLDLPSEKIIRYAGEGERLASGAAHYDNAAAAVLGGFVIASRGESFASMKVPPSFVFCLAMPHVPLPSRKTEYARSLLPETLPIYEAVEAVGAASRAVHGLANRNIAEFGEAMGGGFVDRLRSSMIPHYAEVRMKAMKKGALGVCISGAGPTMLALATRGRAKGVLDSMVGTFRRGGVKCDGFTTLAGGGCRVIDYA